MSMRVMFAGRDPSALAAGAVSVSWISDPRRSAVIAGATGMRMIGGSGGALCPPGGPKKPGIATPAEKTLLCVHSVHCGDRDDFTKCNEKDPRFSRYPQASSRRRHRQS